jgi:hypothetical protein
MSDYYFRPIHKTGLFKYSIINRVLDFETFIIYFRAVIHDTSTLRVFEEVNKKAAPTESGRLL